MLLALAPVSARASAWIAPEKGQEIWSAAAGKRAEARVAETSGYVEIPLSERASVVAGSWMENADDLPDDAWRADASMGFKTALHRGRHTAMAVQAAAIWESDPGQGCLEGGAELRWLGGASFDRPSRPFLNLELAERRSWDGCGQFRANLSAGFWPGDRWLGLAELYLDQRGDEEETVKLQLSLVRFSSEGVGVQLGLRARVDGGAAEPALVLAFWGHPGE